MPHDIEHYCDRIEECEANPTCTPCGDEPCELVTIDIESRIAPHVPKPCPLCNGTGREHSDEAWENTPCVCVKVGGTD